MAVITSNTYLDDTTRTSGETFTMNGGVLTIRTDTRVHANAPSNMCGSVGNMTVSATLGGGIFIDATKVRWLPYSGGTGTVPTIGTTITQGTTNGYLLGVWRDLASAPTQVGQAMPTTGYLKFREVNGTFNIGALSGIGASATSADRVGWIETVMRVASASNIPRAGYFKTRGDWFYLDNTNGIRGQEIQTPTNGGGVNTHVPAIWIETAPNSNEFIAYPCITSDLFNSTNLGTDERSYFAETVGNGVVRIGANGVGYLPQANCRVRIPNIIGRQSLATNDAINQLPVTTIANRPDFITSSAGDIDIEFFINDWYHAYTNAYRVKHINCASFDAFSISNCPSPINLDNLVITTFNISTLPFNLSANTLGGTVKNSKFCRGGATANGHVSNITACADLLFKDNHFFVVQYARSNGCSVQVSQSIGLLFDGLYQYNCSALVNTCFDTVLRNIDHCDRIVGKTNSTTPMYVIRIMSSSNNILCDGLTFGLKGVVQNFCNSYSSVYYVSNSSNITVRNAGTFDNPLKSENTTLAPQYIIQDAGANINIRFQRLYFDYVRSGFMSSINTSKNYVIENVTALSATNLNNNFINAYTRGIRFTSPSTIGCASVYGTHFFDGYTTDTTGMLWFALNEPTAFSADWVKMSLVGTMGGFTSTGEISLPTIGDSVTIEMPYFVIGHTGFANINPIITGTQTQNVVCEYDIDRGNGFSGVYKDLTKTNLVTEVINHSVGFRMRLKITTIAENMSNSIRYVMVNTTTTVQAQRSNLYPLDIAKIRLNGYLIGTRIQIYNMTDNVEVYNGVPSGATLTIETPYTGDKQYRIRAMYQNGLDAMLFYELTEDYTINGLTHKIHQEVDNTYKINGIDGATVNGVAIDDSRYRVDVSTGSISWQALYAYETYWLATVEGIRDEQRFITAIDQANYIFEGFKLKNISSPSIPLVISNGWAKDSITGDTLGLIDTSGGTIFSSPDRVIPFATTGGSALTQAQNTALMNIKSDLQIINSGVQKASLLVPHAENL